MCSIIRYIFLEPPLPTHCRWTVTRDSSSCGGNWSCLKCGVARSRCWSWNRNELRFQIRPKLCGRSDAAPRPKRTLVFKFVCFFSGEIQALVWLCQDAVTFVPFLYIFFRGGRVDTISTDGRRSSNNLLRKLRRAKMWISGQLNTIREQKSHQRSHKYDLPFLVKEDVDGAFISRVNHRGKTACCQLNACL